MASPPKKNNSSSGRTSPQGPRGSSYSRSLPSSITAAFSSIFSPPHKPALPSYSRAICTPSFWPFLIS